MNKLTAEKCRKLIDGFRWMAEEGPGISIRDEYDIQAYEIALPILEQLERGGDWIECSDRLPPDETAVLVNFNGEPRIGELRWDHPTHEESYKSFRYWDCPYNDGQPWEVFDITHWQPLPAPPEGE